jgi:protein TonB
MPAPQYFPPAPAAADKTLFKVAILISLALHLLLLASAGGLLPPISLPSLPHSTLQLTLLKTPPSQRPLQPQLLAQHDSNDTGQASNGQQASPQTAPPATTQAALAATSLAAPPRAVPADNRAQAHLGAAAVGVSWAAYVEDWRRRVESIGNRHYPAEARARGLYGSLELVVTLRDNGELMDVRIARSSGSPLLDQAAIDIVRMGAPYPPFPARLAQEYASLEVVRKWSFTTAHRLDGS